MKTLLVFTIAMLLSIAKLFAYNPEAGDIFFQDGSKSDFNDAVKNVTNSWKGRNFSHCGIAVINKSRGADSVLILEAISEGVMLTPLDKFLARSLDRNGKPKVVVGRLKDSIKYSIRPVIERGEKLLGKAYDDAFDFANDKYYCSELVFVAFLDSANKPIFESNPMTFKNPQTKEIDKNWDDYFRKLGIEVPEGKDGINPGGISLSPALEIIFEYYD